MTHTLSVAHNANSPPKFVSRENHFFCSQLRATYPAYDSLLFTFRTCRWASDSEKWPNRSLAAGTLQFIGRVPKRPRMLAAKSSFPLKITDIDRNFYNVWID